jgi:GT2 family glycosyltransferase
MLTISIVSHGHGQLLRELLLDLQRLVGVAFEVVLTENIPEPDAAPLPSLCYPLHLIRNPAPRGFGANHNAAFHYAVGRAAEQSAGDDAFCVLNPDVRLDHDPFPALLAELARRRESVVAPAITDEAGQPESTARRFPTPSSILRKALAGAPAMEYPLADGPLEVDWVSGVFMLMHCATYARAGGFDERYFLYYEDVDLCARLRARGARVYLVPAARVRHAARRDSHRRPRYVLWPLRSMLRFFLTRY